MDIMQLVDELEAVIDKAYRIPFTSNVVINEDDLFDILDQMRISIPQEIKEARRTEAERERILGRAQEEANRIIELAKEKMMAAVDDHQILEAAKTEAKQIVSQAQTENHQLKLQSNEYVADNLSNLEEHLLKLLTTVRNGLRQLHENEPKPYSTQNQEEVIEEENTLGP